MVMVLFLQSHLIFFLLLLLLLFNKIKLNLIIIVAANPLVAWSPKMSACKRKSALTGGGSGGDPPTVKSER